jgi:hypothetical protein
MKVHDLAALERLRKMRLDRAESELATIRIAMREATLKLQNAEGTARARALDAQTARINLSELRPRDIMEIMDGRQDIAQADAQSLQAREQVNVCHTERFQLLEEQSRKREDWRQRNRALDRWHHLQEGIADEEGQKNLRREDAEDLNRQRSVLPSQQG